MRNRKAGQATFLVPTLAPNAPRYRVSVRVFAVEAATQRAADHILFRSPAFLPTRFFLDLSDPLSSSTVSRGTCRVDGTVLVAT